MLGSHRPEYPLAEAVYKSSRYCPSVIYEKLIAKLRSPIDAIDENYLLFPLASIFDFNVREILSDRRASCRFEIGRLYIEKRLSYGFGPTIGIAPIGGSEEIDFAIAEIASLGCDERPPEMFPGFSAFHK
jgi:hypothetical protein